MCLNKKFFHILIFVPIRESLTTDLYTEAIIYIYRDVAQKS